MDERNPGNRCVLSSFKWRETFGCPGCARGVEELSYSLHIVSVTESDIDKAVDADWGDFEDACVYYAARKIKADAIITRNRKGFAWSSIKVFDCDELFAYLEREVGVSYAGVP